MGWRENMGAETKSNLSIPNSNKSNNSNIRKSQEKELKKTNIADIADIALRIPKVKTSKIIIKKMSTCLHGSRCSFISLVDDKQLCRKNNQPVFEMTACPDGNWERSQDKPQEKKTCYCCGSQTFWRKKNTDNRWICSKCHPPILSKAEIEWL